MFRCVDCGSTFEEPKIRYEKHGLDSPPYEAWMCCPHCNGDIQDYKPIKVAVFKHTLRDEHCVFQKGELYTVTYEDDELYYLGVQNGHKVGISRQFENQLFEIEEVEE